MKDTGSKHKVASNRGGVLTLTSDLQTRRKISTSTHRYTHRHTEVHTQTHRGIHTQRYTHRDAHTYIYQKYKNQLTKKRENK